eukprot:6349762-Prymnesium_polylepis.1
MPGVGLSVRIVFFFFFFSRHGLGKHRRAARQERSARRLTDGSQRRDFLVMASRESRLACRPGATSADDMRHFCCAACVANGTSR